MSQLTIKLSDKADALIAQLQKEIFNRRRKKVSASGVVETLVESGAKSQSDKRFATSWKNLISDIEKAAKLANAHGSKPANLSDAEWALVLSHRARSTGTAKTAAKPAAKRAAKAPAARQPAAKKAPATVKASASNKPAAKAKPKPANAARNPVKKTAVKGTAVKAAAKAKPAAARSSVARRMAKAVSRLNTAAPAAVSSNGAGQLTTVS
jgi:ATP-dependent Clp protease ATP-binding subunit ClpA